MITKLCRVISMLRPELDLVILPGNYEPVREYWDFIRDILGLSQDQVRLIHALLSTLKRIYLIEQSIAGHLDERRTSQYG